MSDTPRKTLLTLTAVVLAAATLLTAAPLPINPGLDFSQFYVDLFGILRGDGVYHHLPHAAHYAAETGRKIALNPPAYPPWYYAFFLPLALFEIDFAARLWATCNVLMFLGAALLLTGQLAPRRRAILISLCFLFAPLIGHIVVGQQTIVLLPALALMIRGIERRSTPETAAGLVLLTFKPHLGVPVGMITAIWLLLRQSPFAISVLARSFAGAAMLIALSLVLDQHSLIDYPQSLRSLSALSLNQICDTCSSLTLTMQRLLPASDSGLWEIRFTISAVLFLGLSLPLFLHRNGARSLICGAVCALVLAAPYVRNYDYVLLLIPLLALTEPMLIRSRLAKVRSLPRVLLCSGGFFVGGVFPLLIVREHHHGYLWISALLLYFASFTGSARVRSREQGSI